MDTLKQVKVLVGDLDNTYLDDEIYSWLLDENGNSIQDTAIEALETILNQIALNNTEEASGGYRAKGPDMEALERRLRKLKAKRKRTKLVPVIIHASRSDFRDIDSIFHKEGNYF